MSAVAPTTAQLLTEAAALLARLRGPLCHMATAAEESAVSDLADGLEDMLADTAGYLDRMAEHALDNVLLVRGSGHGDAEAETLRSLAQIAKPAKVAA
jgi:hypothetical protein